MAAGFRVRRITSTQSIGDKLKRARIRQKISIADVEEGTKIRAKFILALESDSWEQIPSEVYGRGYLERYVQFLQLSEDSIMTQYDRERQTYARKCQELHVELSPKNSLRVPRFLFTPRLVIGLMVLGISIGFVGLVGTQLKHFMAAPYLSLATPVHAAQDGSPTELVVNSDSVNISGHTAAGSTVTVNGKQAMVNDDGSFKQAVAVQKGVNAVVVEAKNAQGKSTSEVLSVIVR